MNRIKKIRFLGILSVVIIIFSVIGGFFLINNKITQRDKFIEKKDYITTKTSTTVFLYHYDSVSLTVFANKNDYIMIYFYTKDYEGFYSGFDTAVDIDNGWDYFRPYLLRSTGGIDKPWTVPSSGNWHIKFTNVDSLNIYGYLTYNVYVKKGSSETETNPNPEPDPNNLLEANWIGSFDIFMFIGIVSIISIIIIIKKVKFE